MDKELEVLIDKKFCEYFIIVWDAINWAKNNDICIGPGRGSVCGSLVAYVLGITEIDPIKYDLYFERFLNPERVKIPDIDVDVAHNKRELLFKYLKKKYGEEHVSLISTFQTFKVKNSIREISKAYSVPQSEVDYCIYGISDYEGLSFFETTNKKLFKNYPKIKDFSKKIFNFPKNLSIHAAGLIISSKPLSSFLPLVKEDIFITQWSSDELKLFGLIKFDFLALQYLSFLSKVQHRIEENKKIKIDWVNLDLEDSRVYQTIIDGRDSFIFQFENPKIKNLISQFKPKSILDLALISAIHRPGASEQIPTLLARRSVKVFFDSTYINNSTEENKFSKILENTYGLLVYQEQLMQIVSLAIGCSFGEADTFRRDLSVSLKSEAQIEECKNLFFDKSINVQKFDRKQIEDVWNSIFEFATYGFNKSHAVAYAVISYRLLWLKTYYPNFFYMELMNISNSEKHLSEIQSLGFNFSPPTFGKSLFSEFVEINKCFYFPVSKIVGISIDCEEKFKKIKFESKNTLDAIKEMINASIDKSTIVLFLRSGFFNEMFNSDEHEFFWESNLSDIYDSTIYVNKNNDPVFDLNLRKVQITDEIKKKYIDYRIDLLGVNFNKNKINPVFFKNYKNIYPIYDLYKCSNGERKKYIGFLTHCKESKTFKDVPFLWIKISDNFFTSPYIAYFNSEWQLIKDAVFKKYAATVLIENKDGFYKALSVKIFAKNE